MLSGASPYIKLLKNLPVKGERFNGDGTYSLYLAYTSSLLLRGIYFNTDDVIYTTEDKNTYYSKYIANNICEGVSNGGWCLTSHQLKYWNDSNLLYTYLMNILTNTKFSIDNIDLLYTALTRTSFYMLKDGKYSERYTFAS